MKRNISIIIFCLLTTAGILPVHSQTASEIADKFLDFSLDKPDLEIKARLFVPDNYNPDSLYPVVMTLHGSGESGTDNYTHVLVNHMATSWGTDVFQSEYPCFIFAPQCPNSGLGWSNSGVYNSVMYLLDSLLEKYSIDTTRIYITGLSMGGNGTWSYLTKDPNLYAAAIPVCGWISGDTEAATNSLESFSHVPVWNFHGAADNVVNTDASRFITSLYYQFDLFPIFTHALYRYRFSLADSILEQLIRNYTEVLYAEVPGIGHNVWDVAYQTPLAKKWLFNQRLHYPDALLLEDDAVELEVTGETTFNYTVGPEVDSITVWISEINQGEWVLMEKVAPSVSYVFNSDTFEDHPFKILRFMAHDTAGHAIGKDFSPLLRINNEGNGAPYIDFITDPTIQNYSINVESFEMEFLVSDPELDPLHLEIYYLDPEGNEYELYAERDVSAGNVTQAIQLNEIPYSDSMVIRAIISDGTLTDTAETMDFRNRKGIVESVKSDRIAGNLFYPNPVESMLSIDLPVSGLYSTEVRDVSGRLIFNEPVGYGKLELNTNEWQPGMYLVNIRMENKTWSSRIVKQ